MQDNRVINEVHCYDHMCKEDWEILDLSEERAEATAFVDRCSYLDTSRTRRQLRMQRDKLKRSKKNNQLGNSLHKYSRKNGCSR